MLGNSDNIPADQVEMFAKIHDDHVNSDHNDYVAAAVSATFSVGPKGAHLVGWITYLNEVKRIHFELTGLSDHSGLGVGFFGSPVYMVQNFDILNFNKANVQYSYNVLRTQLLSDQSPVFFPVLPLAGSGYLPKFEGSISFSAA